jgi:hypothetical protein
MVVKRLSDDIIIIIIIAVVAFIHQNPQDRVEVVKSSIVHCWFRYIGNQKSCYE